MREMKHNKNIKVIILDSVVHQIESQAANEDKEFFGFLTGKIKSNVLTIDGVAFNPYIASKGQAVSQGFMGTDRKDFVGTIHTHPGNEKEWQIKPSGTDSKSFAKFAVNIIANRNGFKVFDSASNAIEVEIAEDDSKEGKQIKDELIHNKIMEDALKADKQENERSEKMRELVMKVLKIAFVVIVISSLLMWYFV